MHRNFEGYSDPTAAIAVGNLMREYRQEQKAKWRRQYEIKNRKKIYVASKYAGDVEANAKAAVGYCRYVISRKCIPIASHLLYPQILRDEDPAERDLGLYFGWVLINKCNEVWVFSDGTISPGMKKEIIRAKSKNMKIRRFDLNCVEEG